MKRPTKKQAKKSARSRARKALLKRYNPQPVKKKEVEVGVEK
jgi:hypothetical protein